MTERGEGASGVFQHYARYYDLLYRDKDYAAEAAYVHGLIQRHAPGAAAILDLGCGTGAHAALLAARGYRVHGVDRSDEMLRRAEERVGGLPEETAARLSFSGGDIRTLRLAERFDTVVALFHVMSYQTTNADLQAAFATAEAHLKPGGLFLFDCWYGPAVLTERPAVRVKRLEDEVIRVTRIAEPVLRSTENIVAVNYHVFVTRKSDGVTEELHEPHVMRYLFTPEVNLFMIQAGFEALGSLEWMTGQAPGTNTWSVLYLAQNSRAA